MADQPSPDVLAQRVAEAFARAAQRVREGRHDSTYGVTHDQIDPAACRCNTTPKTLPTQAESEARSARVRRYLRDKRDAWDRSYRGWHNSLTETHSDPDPARCSCNKVEPEPGLKVSLFEESLALSSVGDALLSSKRSRDETPITEYLCQPGADFCPRCDRVIHGTPPPDGPRASRCVIDGVRAAREVVIQQDRQRRRAVIQARIAAGEHDLVTVMHDDPDPARCRCNTRPVVTLWEGS